MEKRLQEQSNRLRKMGTIFIGLAGIVSGIIFFLPNNETIYWLSANGKEGFYVLSALFFFLGVYCLGAIRRRRHFM